MSSNNLTLADCSSLDSCEILSNKETQTSTAYITDSFELVKGPSRPLPKGIDKSLADGTVNILDCKILKDPSISKTTTIGRESLITDIENSNEDSESPKTLTYSKDVVVPYLNPHLHDCEDNIDSLEKLIQEALEDIPDSKPCFEVYNGKKDINEKVSKDSVKIMDIQQETSKSSSTQKIYSKTSGNQYIPKTTLISSSTKVTQPIVKPECVDDQQIPVDATEKHKEIAKSFSKESITKCIKDSINTIKHSGSSCLEKIEVVIGIKKPENPGEKPTYYLIEKPQDNCNTSHNVQTETGNSLNSIKNLLHNHNEKIAAMKESVKDFAGKCYQTSKDAVTLITSESAKLLNKGKTKVFSDNSSSENQSKRMSLQNISADSITSFLFKKAESKPAEEESPKEPVVESSRKSESTSLAIKPRLNIEKIKNNIVTSKFDKSSLYDKPIVDKDSNKYPQPPETRIPTVSAVDRPLDPPTSTSNMFTFLKSKIFSMFRDESELVEPEIQETVPEDGYEEDPYYERFMEQ